MKKLFRTLSIFLLFFAAFFFTCKVSDLMNTGWSFQAAKHIALVECRIIQPDSLYLAYMED